MRPDKRLHPAGIAVFALSTLREAAIPLLTIMVLTAFGGGFDERALWRTLAYAVAGVAFAAVLGYTRWMTTRWWVSDDGSIHRRSGLISTKATGVPLNRVQSLDIERGPVQRLFGIQALHVQTGGGGKRGEIVLDAVGPDVVEALQALLAERGPRQATVTGRPGDTEAGSAPSASSDGGAGAVAQPPGVASKSPLAPSAQRRMLGSDLLFAALTAGQFGVLLPVLAVLAQLGENLFGFESGLAAAGGLLPDSVAGWVAIVVVLVLAGWLLSIAGTIVAFAGFTVSRDGDRLQIRRGLLVHREATVPIERVRAVEVVEGVLRRPFRLASLRLEVIGHAAEPAAAQTLFPLLRRVEVQSFLDALLPELADDLGGLDPPPRRALRHYVLLPALAGFVAGIVGWTLTGIGVWSLLVVPPAVGYGAARYQAAGWRFADGRFAVRSLRLARTTVLALAINRESHAIAQTVLQRRGNLADLEVDFGKSTTARIRHLDAGVAADAFAAVGLRAPRRNG